jgi:ATP-dependent Lon protease
MEVINLSGYTELEKVHILKRHLLPKQIEENGLNSSQLGFQNKSFDIIIQQYTREAGVRNLEREVGKICRKVATKLVMDEPQKKISITPKRVREYLGVPKYKHGKVEEKNEIGITSGLAWTQAGGELLTTEVTGRKGTGKVQLTGKLGDVMKESAHAALSYVRTNANRLGIYSSVFKETDIHVHVPEGAVPKDGPSAGVTITTSLVSAFTGIPVLREVAMTGEVTLRGKVLPIGGLKEKLLAAKRGMMKTVLIPAKNEKDLTEVPEEIKTELQILSVENMDTVLERALECVPISVSDPEDDNKDERKLSEEESLVPQQKGNLTEPPFEVPNFPQH